MTTYVEYKVCERGFDSELRHGSPTGADAKHGISAVLLADAATDVDDTATQPSDAGVLGLTHLAVVLLHFSRWRYCLLALAMQCIGREQSEATSPNGTGDWTRFRRVYLPQVKDTAYVAGRLAFPKQWGMVELSRVLLSDERKQLLSILPIFAAPYA